MIVFLSSFVLSIDNVSVDSEDRVAIVDRFGSDVLKDFIVTGYAVYENNQKIIIPASYLFAGVLLLLFFISVFSREKKSAESTKEDEKVKNVIDELRKDGVIDVAEKI